MIYAASATVATAQLLNHVQLFVTPWVVAHQAPLLMGFSRQERLSGLPYPSPENFPDPGIETQSPVLQADSLLSEPPGKPQEGRTLVQFISKASGHSIQPGKSKYVRTS